MPPRYSYWTIIAGGLPTAFRAAEREDLMPTFQRLREKHPDAEMKWFARGKLWESPEAARTPRVEHGDRAADRWRDRGDRGDRERRPRSAGAPGGEPRDEVRKRDWRPGGEHRDPRQQFKDAKKARNQRWREEKFERKQRFADTPSNRAGGRPSEHRGGPGADRKGGPPRREWNARPPREKPHGDKFAPRGDRSYRPDKDRRAESLDRQASGRPGRERDVRPPREKPHGDKFRPRDDRSSRPDRDRRTESFDRQSSGQPGREWDARPPRQKPRGDTFAPRGDRSSRPSQERKGGHPGRPRGDWNARPPREKPHGDKFAPRPTDHARRDGPSGGPGDWRKSLPRDSWRDAPREKPHGDKLRAASPARPFSARERFERRNKHAADFGQGGFRTQATEEPAAPPRPRGPNREPKPSDNPAPSAPPRPNEPEIPPPGPPERGRLKTNRRNER